MNLAGCCLQSSHSTATTGAALGVVLGGGAAASALRATSGDVDRAPLAVGAAATATAPADSRRSSWGGRVGGGGDADACDGACGATLCTMPSVGCDIEPKRPGDADASCADADAPTIDDADDESALGFSGALPLRGAGACSTKQAVTLQRRSNAARTCVRATAGDEGAPGESAADDGASLPIAPARARSRHGGQRTHLAPFLSVTMLLARRLWHS